jgi:hypothetical protein
MGRKRKTNYLIAGRPPKDPLKKVGTPARALLTIGVAEAVQAAARLHGIADPPMGVVASDILRLYIYRGLQQDGLLTPELTEDPTWDTLRLSGLV